jgi:sec-independent protein translocase protein TatB
MFGISWHEYLLIAMVALIVIGPKELPRVLRAVGQWTAKVRRMAAEFQGQFQEALREAEMADLKREVDNLGEQARGFTSQFSDPLNVSDATKWEPKPEQAMEPAEGAATEPALEAGKPEDAKPDDAKLDDTVKPPDDPPVAAGTGAAAPAGGGETAPKVEGGVHP